MHFKLIYTAKMTGMISRLIFIWLPGELSSSMTPMNLTMFACGLTLDFAKRIFDLIMSSSRLSWPPEIYCKYEVNTVYLSKSDAMVWSEMYKTLKNAWLSRPVWLVFLQECFLQVIYPDNSSVSPPPFWMKLGVLFKEYKEPLYIQSTIILL